MRRGARWSPDLIQRMRRRHNISVCPHPHTEGSDGVRRRGRVTRPRLAATVSHCSEMILTEHPSVRWGSHAPARHGPQSAALAVQRVCSSQGTLSEPRPGRSRFWVSSLTDCRSANMKYRRAAGLQLVARTVAQRGSPYGLPSSLLLTGRSQGTSPEGAKNRASGDWIESTSR